MTVRIHNDGPVRIVTIDRPERRNAVDPATAAALADAFRELDSDDSVLAGVLTGADGCFCSGADLKVVVDGWEATGESAPLLASAGSGSAGVREAKPRRPPTGRMTPDAGPLGPTRMLLTKPLIAAVEGYAVAGGLELALWCDLRVAARDAVFGVFCRRWGVPLIDGGTVRLPRLIGMSHALDMILTGRGVSGDEALSMGLANRLTEPGQALEHAIALAHELSRLPQACLREDRASAYEQWGLPLEDALRNEHEHGVSVLRRSDFRDGVARFTSGEGRHGAPA